jgi:dipeptidyl aminopeptidase/acylaminoacyl peptidase
VKFMPTAKLIPIQTQHLALLKTISAIEFSCDGARIAYVVTEIDIERDKYQSDIWVITTQGGEPLQLTKDLGRKFAPSWSPNCNQLAFLSDHDDGSLQLYVMPAGGGIGHKITQIENGVGPATWSPDGTKLLFAARVFKKEILASRLSDQGKWRPQVVTKPFYKVDGQGYLLDTCSHLFIVPAGGGSSLQITDGGYDDFSPAWSPDGRQIAFCRKRNGPMDINESDLWVVDADGSNLRQITTNVRHVISPTWSPDGTRIAFYGTDNHTIGFDEALYRVWVVPASSGKPKCLTLNYDRGVTMLPRPAVTPGPVWSPDSATLTFRVSDKGNIHIMRASAMDGMPFPVVIGERQVTSFSAAAGRLAFCATAPYNPSDLYLCAWDGSEERPLTRINEAMLAQLDLPRIERRVFDSPNGGMIDGWIMLPTEGDYHLTLLLDIHGGPHGFTGNYFALSHFYRYVLASHGWAVLTLNPSGSASYGENFTHSIRGRWGEYDMPEHLAAVDALIAEGTVNGNRLSITGYSYGGYMTAWIIGHTDRFKAAVVGAPITNLESFVGTSDIGIWFIPWEMGGDITRNKQIFHRLSPINYADHVTTPTLILHGEADERCPISQGEEFFIGMIKSNTPVEFVRYPGSSHLFHSNGLPSHRMDFNRRTVEWIKRYT